MKIALFGGAFDPPHLGHRQVVASLLEQNLVSEVWLVPTGIHDFNKQMLPSKHRLKMLELLLAAFPASLQKKVRIELCELNRPGVSHTIDTLDQLAQQHSTHQFSWVIGSDNLEKFHLWERYQQILAKYLVYVYPRVSFAMNPLYTGMVPLVGVEQVRVSSTEIKQKVKEKLSIEGLLPSTILQYITDNQLYLNCA